MTDLPEWMIPIRDSALSITGEEIATFLPPDDAEGLRHGAVLMLFGEGPDGPDLLLTERGHQMRSQPGQVSFPGGATDPGDDGPVGTALREAQETGLDPAGVEVLATMPALWLPPRNFAVTPVIAWWREESPVSVVDPIEVHAVLRVPLTELLDPAHRVTVTHPIGYSSPGFLLGEDRDLILWGFTAGIIDKLFDHCGLTRPWDTGVKRPLPDSMLRVRQDDRR